MMKEAKMKVQFSKTKKSFHNYNFIMATSFLIEDPMSFPKSDIAIYCMFPSPSRHSVRLPWPPPSQQTYNPKNLALHLFIPFWQGQRSQPRTSIFKKIPKNLKTVRKINFSRLERGVSHIKKEAKYSCTKFFCFWGGKR